MTPDRGHRRGERMGDRFDYRRWAADGFHLYDDDTEDDEDRRDDGTREQAQPIAVSEATARWRTASFMNPLTTPGRTYRTGSISAATGTACSAVREPICSVNRDWWRVTGGVQPGSGRQYRRSRYRRTRSPRPDPWSARTRGPAVEPARTTTWRSRRWFPPATAVGTPRMPCCRSTARSASCAWTPGRWPRWPRIFGCHWAWFAF